MTENIILINGQEVKLIPYGYCLCGCGQKTKIAPKNVKRLGWIKNRPVKFINGHNGRKAIGSIKHGRRQFPMIKVDNHPRADGTGYVYEYVLLAEKALGKPLPVNAVIHHHNSTQLVICQDQSYHMLIELRTRAYKACGHANWRKCMYCQKWDEPDKLKHQKNGLGCYHRSCRQDHRRAART